MDVVPSRPDTEAPGGDVTLEGGCAFIRWISPTCCWNRFVCGGRRFCPIARATRPEYQRRGLAGRLLDEVLREATNRGCGLAQITTFIGNDAAQPVYEKAGLTRSNEKRCSEMAAVLNAPGFARFLPKL